MTPELQKAINEMLVAVITAATPVIVATILWAFKLARDWVLAHIALIKDQQVREAMEFALKRLDGTAQTVVEELNQTLPQMVKSGRLKMLDGKLSDGEKAGLRKLAVTRVINRLPAEATEVLKASLGSNFDAAVMGKIESKVSVDKKKVGAPGPSLTTADCVTTDSQAPRPS